MQVEEPAPRRQCYPLPDTPRTTIRWIRFILTSKRLVDLTVDVNIKTTDTPRLNTWHLYHLYQG